MTMSPEPPSLRPRPSSHATRAEKWECRLWDISHTDGRTDGELVVLGKYGRAWQCWHWLESDDDTTLNFSSDSTKPPPPPLPLPAVPSSSWYINGLNTHTHTCITLSIAPSFWSSTAMDWLILVKRRGGDGQYWSYLMDSIFNLSPLSESSPVQFTILLLSLFFLPNSQVAQRDDRRVACPCVNKFWRLNTKARRSWVMQFNISLSRLF